VEKTEIRINARTLAEGYLPRDATIADLRLEGDSLIVEYKAKTSKQARSKPVAAM